MLENGLLAATFTAIYLVMPFEKGIIYDIDNRALPYIWLFLVAAAAHTRIALTHRPADVAATAVALTVANLVYIGAWLLPSDALMGSYRAAIAKLPAGAMVLPVLTEKPIGRMYLTHHAHSFALVDRGAVSPYLFAGSTSTTPYFDFRDTPPAPDQYWYTRTSQSVDWETIGRTYDFLVAMKPFDPERVGLLGPKFAESGAAVVYWRR